MRLRVLLVTLLASSTVVPSDSVRADCIEYSDDIHLAAFLSRPGVVYGVAVAQGYAYLAESDCLGGESCFEVVDISDPRDPEVVGHLGLTQEGVRVAVCGDFAYVTEGHPRQDAATLLVIDISDPHAPRPVGSLQFNTGVCGVAIAGSRAYVANNSCGLQIVDVSDPNHPRIAATLDSPGEAQGVAVGSSAGGATHVYLADGPGGLLVIQTGSSIRPRVLGRVLLDGGVAEATDVAVCGSWAYVSAGHNGLYVVDIAVPTQPHVVGHIETPGYAFGVAIDGADRVCVADGYRGLQVIDVTNPADPRIAGSVNSGYMHSCTTAGDFAYAAAYCHGFQVFDISGETSTLPLGSVATPGQAQGIVASGDYAYMGCGEHGLCAIDVADDEHPVVVGSVETPGWASGPVLMDHYVYLPDHNRVVQVIDVADPHAPHVVTAMSTYRDAAAMVIEGRYAYLSEDGYSFQVFDLVDPLHPQLMSTLSGIAAGPLAVTGDYAYIASWTYLSIVCITDPRNPVLCGQMPLTGPTAVVAAGSCLYLSENYPPRLSILDISVPGSPVRLGSVRCVMWATNVAISEQLAYLTTGEGVHVVDISDGAHPFVLGQGDTPDLVDGVALADDAVYLSVFGQGYFSGLVIFPSECPDRSEVPDGLGASSGPPWLRVVPNPVRERTRISLELPEAAEVRIAIHDPAGRLLRVLQNGRLSAGSQRFDWDGRDALGHPLPSGVYWARMSMPGASEMARILVER